MMSSKKIAIGVSSISKIFHIYENPSDRLKQFIFPRINRLVGRGGRCFFKTFDALTNVTFNVYSGETVGIVGRNGSGKSTILQIICGTLSPSAGSVSANGRIAALLELGAGFNPEYTGRENVYLNATVLGLSDEEIRAKFGEIESFADIGEFIDRPTKTYSSGMLVRLAFAVAINVDPEILVIDEALAVGDELFQRKCFAKIEKIKERGATILFVSHSGATVVELCDRAILLDAGEKITEGKPKDVIEAYQKLLYSAPDKRDQLRSALKGEADSGLVLVDGASSALAREAVVDEVQSEQLTSEALENFDEKLTPTSSMDYDQRGAWISDPVITALDGRRVNGLLPGRFYKLSYEVSFYEYREGVRFGMLIKSTTGLTLGGGISAPSLGLAKAVVAAGEKTRVSFKFRCNLNPGTYFVNCGVLGILDGEEVFLHRRIDVCAFRVLPHLQGRLETEIVSFDVSAELAEI